MTAWPEFSDDDRVQAIVDRAARWLGSLDLGQFTGTSNRPGHIGPTEVIGPIASELPARIARVRKRLNLGGDPKKGDYDALESLFRVMRPSLPVTGGSVGDLQGEIAERFPTWSRFEGCVRPFLRGIARVDGASSGAPDCAFGTGFVVGHNVLVTNQHVVNDLEEKVGPVTEGSWFARFGVESTPDPRRRRVPITGVLARSASADLALLSVARTFGRPLPLASAGPVKRARVAAIGYPSRDTTAPSWVDVLFDQRYGVERVSPGEVLARNPTGFLHDCSTMAGSSGSPVVDIPTASVVGVHAGGDFLISNRAVGVEELQSFVAEHIT